MIMLTRLSGSAFALNADLIERIDTTPDTVVTLVDGKKYLVTETITDIVAAVRQHRAEIIALSDVVDVLPLLPEPEPEHQRLGTVTELTSAGHGRADV